MFKVGDRVRIKPGCSDDDMDGVEAAIVVVHEVSEKDFADWPTSKRPTMESVCRFVVEFPPRADGFHRECFGKGRHGYCVGTLKRLVSR